MVLLDQSKFLTELSALFQATRDKGSLSITHKRRASPRLARRARAARDRARSAARARRARPRSLVRTAVSEKDKKAEGAAPADGAGGRHDVLVRARTEKKKLSVVVPATELVKFQASLAGVMKNSFTNLKKKVREKKDKKKALKPDA